MKMFLGTMLVLTLLLASATLAGAQGIRNASTSDITAEPTPQAGYIYMPDISKERPEDAGIRFHLNYVLHSPDGKMPVGLKSTTTEDNVVGPLTTVEIKETPDSMGCLYVNSPSSVGCVPTGSGGPSPAGWGAIALVDPFNNPDALADLQTFDAHFGLIDPPAFFVVYANGNGDCATPANNAKASIESSLDIEWAHVFAPNAVIILVEACSLNSNDMMYAEQVAFNQVMAIGLGGAVSNSWGGAEFGGENSYDVLFASWNYTTLPIVTLASAGDSGCGATYPSSNPWLVSAGGTSVLRNSVSHKFYKESCWGGSGGGSSTQEVWSSTWVGGTDMGAWADYQYPIFGTATRQTPDISFNSDPSSGVWIDSQYGFGCSSEPCFGTIGGTSVASPALAGIVNRAGNKLGTYFFYGIGSGYYTNEENNLIYSQLPTVTAYKKNFYDINSGSNGCKVGGRWDYCTGVGSPRGLLGK